MKITMEGKMIAWISLCLYICLLTIQVEAEQSEMDKLIQNKFKLLADYYSKNGASIKSDCKVADSANEGKFFHRGTKSTLEFLSKNFTSTKDHFPDEDLIDRNLLRKFLVRVGFLRSPGSLILVEKHTSTLKLAGCKKDSVWIQHGISDEDDDFASKHKTGDIFRDPPPQPTPYIVKLICFNVKEKCSHDFYVITKPSPELPPGLQVSEGKDSDEYEFACSMSYCRIQPCKIPGTKKNYHLRQYPPYKIKWRIPDNLRKVTKLSATDKFVTETNKDKMKSANIKFFWELKVLTEKDADEVKGSSYKKPDKSIYLNAFGDDKSKNTSYIMSRIVVQKADRKMHDGPYECIVMDGNGVVSAPYKENDEYRGVAMIHVMPAWQKYGPFVAAAIAIVLVAIIILICPKKMEYDDGTPYTKDELVSPAEVSSGGK